MWSRRTASASISAARRPGSKSIWLAAGERSGAVVRLQSLQPHASLRSLGDALRAPGPWVGGFDLPFGLPRELVEALGWPLQWPALMHHYCGLDARADSRHLRGLLRCATRRAQVRAPRLRRAGRLQPVDEVGQSAGGAACCMPACRCCSMPGVHLPGLHDGDTQPRRARSLPGPAGARADRPALVQERPARAPHRRARQARDDIVLALEQGRTRLGLRLQLSAAQRDGADRRRAAPTASTRCCA